MSLYQCVLLLALLVITSAQNTNDDDELMALEQRQRLPGTNINQLIPDFKPQDRLVQP